MRTLLVLAALTCASAARSGRGTTTSVVSHEIEEAALPELLDFLTEVGLEEHHADFLESGFDSTRLVMRMKSMDFHIFSTEWGLSTAQAAALKARIAELKTLTVPVTETTVDPLLVERSKLSYGRLYLNRSTASYEFYTAYFGDWVPRGYGRIVLADPRDGCGGQKAVPPGTFLFADRGECSFLDKARNASAAGAAALVIANHDEKLFRIASAYESTVGNGDARAEDELPSNLAVVLVPHAAVAPVRAAVEADGPGVEHGAAFVPLRCTSGSVDCVAVLPEERAYAAAVDGGLLTLAPGAAAAAVGADGEGDADATAAAEAAAEIAAAQPVEFLTSIWGGILPHPDAGAAPLVLSYPLDACTPVENAAELRGAVAFVMRGGCAFGAKALAAQAAGARALVIMDTSDDALQRIGASPKDAETLGIPGVIVAKASGKRIRAALMKGASLEASFAATAGVSELWHTLSTVAFPEGDPTAAGVVLRRLRTANADSDERLAWIQAAYNKAMAAGEAS